MNISEETQAKINELSELIQTAQRYGNNKLGGVVNLVNEIKRRNHAMLSDRAVKRVNNLLDITIGDVKAWLYRQYPHLFSEYAPEN